MPGPSRDRNGSFNNSTLMDSTANGNNATVCLCNQDAILLTVKKDGPNKGESYTQMILGWFLVRGNPPNFNE